jgi:hypothetical protein
MDARHAMQKVDHASRQELSFSCGTCAECCPKKRIIM